MKSKLIIALIGASAASFAQAQAYIGANAGQSAVKADLRGFQPWGYYPFETRGAAAKLYGGYQLTPTFGLEAGYVYFGDGNLSGANVTIKPETLYVAGTATLPINQEFAVFAKAGAARTRSEFNVTGNNFNAYRNTPLLGIGASYAFTKNISGVLEYENFGKIVKSSTSTVKADLVSVGVRYKF